MTTCPNCRLPILDGEHVRVQLLAVYHKAVQPLHAIDPYEEETVQHLNCGQQGSGD